VSTAVQVSPIGPEQRVLARDRFDLNVRGFTACRYRHESRGLWRGGCPERVHAATDPIDRNLLLWRC